MGQGRATTKATDGPQPGVGSEREGDACRGAFTCSNRRGAKVDLEAEADQNLKATDGSHLA